MNSVRYSMKYQGFPPSGCQDIGIRKFELAANSIPLIHSLKCQRSTTVGCKYTAIKNLTLL